MNISAIFRTFFISFVLSFLFPYIIFAQTYEHATTESDILVVGDVVVLKSGSENTYLIDNNGSFETSGDCNSKNAWWNVTANGFQNIGTGKYILCTPTNGSFGNGSASYSLSLDNGTPIAVTGTNWYVGSATNWFGASTTYFRPNNTGTTGVAYNNSSAVKAYKRIGLQLVFVHSKGVTKAPFTHEGRQQTHEITEVLYANTGEEKSLKAQVSDLEIYEGNDGWHYMCGFYRWSDFANDGNVGENLICDDAHKGNYTSTTNTKGFYLTKNTEPGRFTYKMDGNVRKVVCEVSAYADYQSSYDFDSNVSTFVEPTLSYRQIFEIRPASEMADKLDDCTNKPLEEYNIIAPAGEVINIGPKYAWSGNDAKIVNYYYTNKEGNIVHAQNCVWTKNGASYTAGTVLDNRVISVTAPSAGQTDIYELKTSTGLIIARFNIETLASSAIGPSTTAPNLISEEELAEKYELSVALDFDKLANGNERSGDTIDGNSLAWHETSYGFLYPSLREYRSNLRGSFAEWSEYAIVKNTTSLSIRTVGLKKPGEWRQTQEIGSTSISSDKTGGYFMFVNANNISGKVADLEVNKQICQGSIVVSAWVANAAASGSNVNLNFVVAGVDEDGFEYDIKTFTTGDIGNNGKWQQIMFKVDLDFDFPKYRIRIDNNEADANGNCFAIDDIRIYMSKPKLAGTQVMATCPSWDMSDPKAEEENIALLRVDFVNTLGKTNGMLTYTWVDSKSTATLLDFDYVGENGSNNLGKITLNGSWTQNSQNVKDRYYNSVSEFLDSDKHASLGSDKSDYFFTTEPSSDGDVLVLYVVHKSNKFKANNKYYSIVTFENVDLSDAEKLQNILAECSSYATFEVMPRARIVLAGDERNSAVLQNLAVGNYPLSVRAFGMENDKVVGYDCAADWLIVTKDMTDAEKWGYADAIIRFRSEYGYDVGKEKLSNTVFPGLYSLGDNLILNQEEIAANISERGVPQSFIAVPLPIENNNGFTPCQIPLEIVLQAKVSAVLANPEDTELYENKPVVVQGSNCIIRIPEDTTSLPEMKVDFINYALLANLSDDNLTKLGNMVLCTTDNADYEKYRHGEVFFTLQSSKSGTALNELKAGDIVTITPTDLAKQLPAGKYGFHSELLAIDDISITPAFNFDIYVVPSTVVWNPTLNNSAWHNDANWKTTDGKPAFIPLAETDVIIKEGVYNAVLPESSTALGAGANQYLKYDIGVDYSSCKNIYFEAGAKLGRQHKLNYTGTAYVDMPISNNEWQMLSMPIEGVVSGDLYIPKAGDGTFNWSVNAVDNRNINTFQLKVYNVALKGLNIKDRVQSDTTYTNYSETKWSLPTNALNMPMDKVRGYAVRKQASVQDFVRLPKSAKKYSYYYATVENGAVTKDEPMGPWATVDVTREGRVGKLIFDKDNSRFSVTLDNVEPGNLFLIGNPFVANLNVKEFFKVNSSVLDDSFYYEYADGEIVPNQASENRVLRPMRAMFVKTKNATTSLTLTFTADMISFSESAGVEVVPNKAPRRSLEELSNPKLTLTAQLGDAVSRIYIEDSYGSSSSYDSNEDAELIVLDKDLTPISLYSVADNYALLYNRMPKIDGVPISVLVTDSALISDLFTLTFEGVDDFGYDLYLYDALYDTELPLIDELTIELELPTGGEVRYYIKAKEAQGGITTDEVDVLQSKICVVSTKGRASVYSTANMNSIAIYDVAGRLMSVVESLNRKEYDIELPMGVYMLQITTEGDVYQEKVVIK